MLALPPPPPCCSSLDSESWGAGHGQAGRGGAGGAGVGLQLGQRLPVGQQDFQELENKALLVGVEPPPQYHCFHVLKLVREYYKVIK